MGEVRKLKVTLETVTPLFLGGAEPRGKPELRAPSFRGAMRYWWRALVGAHLGDNLRALKRAEGAVFGSTDEASSVVVQVKGRPGYANLEQRPVRTSGYNYLYWSLFLQRKGENPRCIAPGSTFVVSLGLRPGIHQDKALWQAATALWLTVRLGGLGARSRRTLGSLAATKQMPSESPLPPFVSSADCLRALAAELEAGLRTLRGIVGVNGGGPAQRFNVLHRDRCAIWVVAESQPWPTWEDAAESIGTALHEFRRRLPLHQREALGLPLRGLRKRGPRRYASPLILTLAPLRGKGVVGVVVMFEPLIGPSIDFKDSLVHPFVERFEVKEEVSL